MEKNNKNGKAIEQTAPKQQDDRELAQGELDAVSGGAIMVPDRR